MNGVWEPWTPEVGQRVVLRVSAECRLSTRPDQIDFDGATATVEQIVDWPTDGHRYFVKFDDPDLDRRQGLGVRIAACELVPADAPPPADEQGVRP